MPLRIVEFSRAGCARVDFFFHARLMDEDGSVPRGANADADAEADAEHYVGGVALDKYHCAARVSAHQHQVAA